MLRELKDWSERGSENLEGTLGWVGTDRSDGRAQRRTLIWKVGVSKSETDGWLGKRRWDPGRR